MQHFTKFINLGFSLDGSTMFQQDLNDANVTIPGCTVERSELILQRKGQRKTDEEVLNNMLYRNKEISPAMYKSSIY